MAEPHSSVIGACVGAACSTPVYLFGADPLALSLGMASAVLSSIVFPTVDDKLKSFAGVCIAGLLAGFGTPFALLNVPLIVPKLIFPAEQAIPLMSIVIGLIAPPGIPLLLGRFWKGKGGEQ